MKKPTDGNVPKRPIAAVIDKLIEESALGPQPKVKAPLIAKPKYVPAVDVDDMWDNLPL